MLNLNSMHQFLAKHAHRILALMLLSLHAFLLWDDANNSLAHAVFLCHYGLFLMWQPIWRNAEKLSLPSAIVFFAFAGLSFTILNWWIIALWLAILLGLLGGRIFGEEAKPNRMIHILAASYLLAMLLLWVVPKLLNASADLEAATFTITYLMPLLPIAILFLSSKAIKTSDLPIIDFFYTLVITLIAIIIILASYAIGSQNQVNYIQVMFITIFSIALSLVALSFLWKPSARFSGVELLMSRYLSSIGMPFEKWVKNISNLAKIELSAEDFLKESMQEMTLLPWVSGVSWEGDNVVGETGEQSEHTTEMRFKDLKMTLHSRWKVSPALYVHVTLLTQIMGEFYEAKRREETLRQNAYMQAFYESGSRLTHDIKNILQSVGTLVTAAQQTENQDSDDLLELIRRQLPALNQRIASTLDKLKEPGEIKKRLKRISAWWSVLQVRHQLSDVQFSAESLPAIDINAEILDSVIDNLINNALEKAKYQPATRISVTLYDNHDTGFCIDVLDTGEAVPEDVAENLFKKHISSSDNGMGVGLYHAAIDAEQAGYTLSLANNQENAVCFRLSLNNQKSS